MLVSSVLSFQLWWSSNELSICRVFIVNRIALKTQFILSMRPGLSSKLAIIKFLNVFIERSTAPVPVCNLGGLSSFSMFLLLQNVLCSFDMNALPLSDFFLGDTVTINEAIKKSYNFFTSVDLHTWTTGHSLYRSMPIWIYGSPFICLSCSFPEK